ncbi:MAG TPA: ATP-binding protein [Rudaea sp.]|nr:ATP-binding protein [Rudaea sp.]
MSDTRTMDVLPDQLATGIAVYDPELRCAYANAAFCEAIGAGFSRLRGQGFEALGPPGAVLAPLAERARSAHGPVAARALELVLGGGNRLRADIIVSALADGRTLVEVHALAPDEAVPVRLSETLRGLAHEVKNPLAGVRGAAQLLKRRVHGADVQHLADLIIAEADRLAALADRLLHPGGKVAPDEVNLHEVAERARALIAAQARPELELRRDYDPSLPALHGHADRLLQLVLNLLRNAVEAQAHTITVRTRAEHRVVLGGETLKLALRLDVVDDGVGVPDALRDTMFLPLVSGNASGSGLGLALAQEIAHEHGGRLSHHDHAGQTVFSLLLPVEPA